MKDQNYQKIQFSNLKKLQLNFSNTHSEHIEKSCEINFCLSFLKYNMFIFESYNFYQQILFIL